MTPTQSVDQTDLCSGLDIISCAKETQTDVTLLDVDFSSILESKTITDDIIKLYYGILESKFLDRSTHLLNPAIAQAIKCLDVEGLEDIVAPLNLEEKKYIFIPISDAPGIMMEAGTHWSLLLFVKETKSFYYFDSIRTSNLRAAKQVAEKLVKHLKLFALPEGPPIIPVTTPQQNQINPMIHPVQNDDCAIYVLLVTDVIIEKILNLKLVESGGKLGLELPAFNVFDVLMKRAQLVLLLHKRQYQKYSLETLKSLIFHNHGPKNICTREECQKSLQEKNNKLKEEITLLKEKLLSKPQNSQSDANLSIMTKSGEIENSKKAGWKNKDWTTPFSKRKHKTMYTSDHAHMQDFILPTCNKYNILHIEDEEKEGMQKSATRNQRRGRKKKTQNKQTPVFGREIKMSVFADSQGRDVWFHLDQINNLELKTSAVVLPGAPLLHVVESALQHQLTTKHANEVVVLLGGTNDTTVGDSTDIYKCLEQKLAALDEQTSVLLSTIPKRHDKNILHPINIKIIQVNNYLQEVAARLKQTRIIDLDELDLSYHFVRSGFHLNRNGKKKFAHLIIHELGNIFEKSEKEENLNKLVLSCAPQNSKIQITEKNMRDVIHDTRTEVGTAFAHCVSEDFFMVAGVAVIMREEFGRPSASDYISSHLTFQKTSHGASVYSLVTKPRYFMKPKICDYDLAFDQLVEDFKEKGFKKLICSPLGCVRDRINPYIFAKQLVEFQHKTGAAFEIVSYCQDSERELLRNSLPHEEFQQRLVYNINLHELRKSSDSVLDRISPPVTPTRLLIQQRPSSAVSPLSNQSSHESSPPHQDPVVVPGILTYSEELKQSSDVSSNTVSHSNVNPGNGQSLALNSNFQQNTTIK